jgi:nanoRNase/pAp phosphatase (c-di-AMP/oligoRNAs hydrolase)
MVKKAFSTIHEKNAVIGNIKEAFVRRDNFLVIGHQNPDEDCIASMVAVSLILSKFYKDTAICLSSSIHEHFRYLLHICRYNSISLLGSSREIPKAVDTVIVCDTPKRSMIESIKTLEVVLDRFGVTVIEIDHHLGGDSEYIGDEGYRLVTEASSTSELVGHLAFKLAADKKLLQRFQVNDLFSRNLVLAVLTGIIGDTNMGSYLQSRREKKFYDYFTTVLNSILVEKTIKDTNIANKEELFLELQKSSTSESYCFEHIMQKKRFSRSIGYVLLGPGDVAKLRETCLDDAFVAVTRAAANTLAEESGKLGLVVFCDGDEETGLVQFRLRRSRFYREFDLRGVLPLFSITDGGGHEGAIGFRVARSTVGDLESYVVNLIAGIEFALPA